MEGCCEVAKRSKSEIRIHKVVIAKLPSIRSGLGAEPTSGFAPRSYRTE